jgi:hypothetical protein
VDGSCAFPLHRKHGRKGRFRPEPSSHSEEVLPTLGGAGSQQGALSRPAFNNLIAFMGVVLKCPRVASVPKDTMPALRANQSELTEEKRAGLIFLWLSLRHKVRDRSLQNGPASTLIAGADGELDSQVHQQVACEGRIRHQTSDPWLTAYTGPSK